MVRIEVNVQTGAVTQITLTAEEEAAAVERTALYAAENTLDMRAARAIDTMDRLQFEHLFDLENRTRVVEARPQITRVQYRTALIDRWKALNQ
jgi:hypothetical protein